MLAIFIVVWWVAIIVALTVAHHRARTMTITIDRSTIDHNERVRDERGE